MSSAAVGFIGSITFIGWSIGCIVLPPFADKNGRKLPFITSLLVTAVTWTLILITTDYYLILAEFFLFGLCKAGVYSVGYVFMTEQVHKVS